MTTNVTAPSTCSPRLNLTSGLVIHQLTARHRAIEFKKFLDLSSGHPRRADVHVVLDNSSTHKTPAIKRWLVRHPRFEFHFTPTSSSWMNLVERWFAEITTKWIRRGTHRSVKELAASITYWVGTWNEDPRPYVWHKTADEIFDSLARYCQRISESGPLAGLTCRAGTGVKLSGGYRVLTG